MTGPEAMGALLSGAVALDASDQAALRGEVELMVDALSMLRESLAQVSRDADARSRRDGEVADVSDPWLLGYAAGKAREAANMSAIAGMLQNSLDVWATSRQGQVSARVDSEPTSICETHHRAVLREYPDANMSKFRVRPRCGNCEFCRDEDLTRANDSHAAAGAAWSAVGSSTRADSEEDGS